VRGNEHNQLLAAQLSSTRKCHSEAPRMLLCKIHCASLSLRKGAFLLSKDSCDADSPELSEGLYSNCFALKLQDWEVALQDLTDKGLNVWALPLITRLQKALQMNKELTVQLLLTRTQKNPTAKQQSLTSYLEPWRYQAVLQQGRESREDYLSSFSFRDIFLLSASDSLRVTSLETASSLFCATL